MEKSEDVGREAWMLLFQLFRSQRREMMTLHSDFQMNPAQVHLLLNLEPDQGVPMSDLAGALACDASYITGLVDKIEDRGLVQRLPNPADRRVKLIALTAEGAEIRGRLLERCSQPPTFIAALSETDKTALRDIFRRATQHAQAPSPAQASQ
ncbi:MAG TPA: MarR family winged helix-turn-helix transcriptional regulator [Caulobacteraceae bacterium]|jgi:DNA-binding MarR family transcriptional regulator|nr:MarR family winged helix-turn-helix transcriptional regulator [Caulobacteraceae bacterium]